MRYISGLVAGKGNLLGRPNVTITPSDEDSLFLRANLWDGLPSRRFKFGTNSPDSLITADLNEVLNPGFETSTLANWNDASGGTGTTAETVVGAEVHTGAKAMKIGGGAAGTGIRTQALTVRSGERRKSDIWIRGDGTKFARFRIQNVNTGNYLKSDGTWTATPTDLFTESGTTYQNKTIPYQVESWTVCQSSLVTLTLICYVSENGFGYFDDITDYAAWNFAAVIGHNIAPVVVPQLRSSTNNFGVSDTLEATLTPYQPGFYGYMSAASFRRYARLKLAGTNVATSWLGEAILGYAETVISPPNWAFPTSRTDRQIRTDGGEYAFLTALGERGDLHLSFRQRSETSYLEMLQDIWRRSRGGADTTVIVPIDNESRVFLGRLDMTLDDTRRFLTLWEHDLPLTGLPLPSIVT